MKRIAQKYCNSEKWEKAFRTIYYACGYMYNMNQILADPELEKLVEYIVQQNLPSIEPYEVDSQTVLFYDSFGKPDRGLTGIYIQALNDLGYKVQYVTPVSKYDYKNNKNIHFDNWYIVEGKQYLDKIEYLAQLVRKTKASKIFMYLMPEDLVAVGAFGMFSNIVERYQINLTDHAFWLGTNISDIVINFREFGAKVCEQYRGIQRRKNVYLPYYPKILCTENKKLERSVKNRPYIFSGGDLYKTQSKDKKFYKIVENILREVDVNFVYFGKGNARSIRKLQKHFPDRIFFERERTDFFDVLKESILYLSTYPYNGGLMTQYALLANKIPVTLNASGIEAELTINHKDTFWNYSSEQACLEEIVNIVSNKDYRMKKETQLKKFIIDKEQFADELKYIIDYKESMRKVNYKAVCIEGFQSQPLWYYSGIRYNRLFFRKNGMFFLKHFPIRFLLGMFGRINEKYETGI